MFGGGDEHYDQNQDDDRQSSKAIMEAFVAAQQIDQEMRMHTEQETPTVTK